MHIGRHSFIRQSKLSDVKGRVDYISNPKRQEHLYATYQTEGVTPEFWKNLAKENQQDFRTSGTEGNCIEARELIIALPENFTEYRADDVVGLFTKIFHERYGVECSAALHHNKVMTNYHIHLIFSERKLLECPKVKIASRNMFYDENGKHVRTKKEILDESGNVREGCNIIPKGEVYESHLFTVKNEHFKSKAFTGEVKEMYTKLINNYVKDEAQKLSVFQPGGIYLPTKKIGKNNPKAAEIRADNAARQEWNRTVDVALAEGVVERQVAEIKQKEITEKVGVSITENGRQPGLLRSIVTAAIHFLAEYVRKLQMPPKPKLEIDIEEFRQMEQVKEELDRQLALIHHTERVELPKLEKELHDIKGLFKGKERKAAQNKIDQCQKRLSRQKDGLKKIVRESGYPSVKSFMDNYNRAYDIVAEYQRELKRWEQQNGQEKTGKKQPELNQKESVRARLQKKVQLVEEREQNRQQTRTKERGAR